MDQPIDPRALTVHKEVFVVDAHFDLPFDLLSRRERGDRKVFESRYQERLVAGGVDLLVAAVFVEDLFLPEMGLRRALDEIAGLLEDLETTPGLARICRTMDAVRESHAAGRLALLLSLEGADPIGNDLALLRVFYELGVRAMGLTWSRRNYVADGSSFQPEQEGPRGGLTAFGVKVVEKAQTLGMVLDVSHLNDAGVQDVLEIADAPVIASHSNCRALRSIPRNLSDPHIEALAAKGGVVGINAIDKFLCDDPAKASISHMLDHIDHVVKIAGVDHVGIGLDLCSGFENYHNLPLSVKSRDVVDGHGMLPAVTAGLLDRGYGEADVAKILGGNFARVFNAIL